MSGNTTLLTIFLVCSAIVFQGCSSDNAGTGAAAEGSPKYSMGELESVEAKSINVVYDAALKSMDELKLPVIQKGVDAMSGKIVGRDVADKKINIILTATPDGKTKLSVKVGLFGDQSKSRLIYEQIKKKL